MSIPTNIPDFIHFIVQLFNGTNQLFPTISWNNICPNVPVTIGGVTGTLDPLQLGNAASVRGGTDCHNDTCWWQCYEGASANANLQTLSGLHNALVDESSTTVQYLCTSPTVGTVVATMPATCFLDATCNYGFQVGIGIPFVPCISHDETDIHYSSTFTVDVVITIPFTLVDDSGVTNAQLDLTTCALKVENCRNMSLVTNFEADVRAVLEGLTLGILAIDSVWDSTFQPVFDDLNDAIYNALNNNVLPLIPSDVISNALPAGISVIALPATSNACVQLSVSMSSLSAATSISSSEANYVVQILRSKGYSESQVAYLFQQYKTRRMKAVLEIQRKIQLAQYMRQRKAAKKLATPMRLATSCYHHCK